MVATVGKETLEAVARLFPEKPGGEPREEATDAGLQRLPIRKWQPVTARLNGYPLGRPSPALCRHRSIRFEEPVD